MPSDSNGPSAPRVLLSDRKSDRTTQIRRAHHEDGMTIRAVDSPDEPDAPTGGMAAAAAVALGGVPLDQEISVSLIRDFNRSNYLVLGFENGVGRWPLGTQCRALLAGAKYVFDSKPAESLTSVKVKRWRMG